MGFLLVSRPQPPHTHTHPATSESKPHLKEEVFQNTFPAYIHHEGQIQVRTDILLWQRPTFSLRPPPCHTHPGTGWPLWPEHLDLAYRQRFALIMHLIIVPIHIETAFPIRVHWSSPFTCFLYLGSIWVFHHKTELHFSKCQLNSLLSQYGLELLLYFQFCSNPSSLPAFPLSTAVFPSHPVFPCGSLFLSWTGHGSSWVY